jgi:hypothetical protein
MNEHNCTECGTAVPIKNALAGMWATLFGITCDDCRRKRWYDEEEPERADYAELPY